MRVLVTGASGMLGGATALALLRRGDDVTVMQRKPSGLPCREVLGDLGDATAVGRACAGQDAVVHAAAKVDVVGPAEDFDRVNRLGTRHVVDACRNHAVSRLVFVSSPSVAHTGRALIAAGAEPADPLAARGHYSRSKAAAELLALDAATDDLSVTAIRPHLVWGPGDTQLTQRIIDRAADGRLPLIGTGSALIDTTYVDNAVDALVAALDRCQRLSGRAFVVSNGEPRPVAEVIARLCLAGGVSPPGYSIPTPVARVLGAGIDRLWQRLGRLDTPPLTRFLVEQLSTAHWFDQRQTRLALDWSPAVSLAQGFDRLSRALSTPPPAR